MFQVAGCAVPTGQSVLESGILTLLSPTFKYPAHSHTGSRAFVFAQPRPNNKSSSVVLVILLLSYFPQYT